MLKYFNKIYNWTFFEFDNQSKNEIVDTNDQHIFIQNVFIQNIFIANIDIIDEKKSISQFNHNKKSIFAKSTKNVEMITNFENSISNNANDVNMNNTNVNFINVKNNVWKDVKNLIVNFTKKFRNIYCKVMMTNNLFLNDKHV